jgi:hypothetical protein
VHFLEQASLVITLNFVVEDRAVDLDLDLGFGGATLSEDTSSLDSDLGFGSATLSEETSSLDSLMSSCQLCGVFQQTTRHLQSDPGIYSVAFPQKFLGACYSTPKGPLVSTTLQVD